MQEVTVLVCGFDKERVLYKGFDYFWKKYWPDCPWALRYMVNEIPFGYSLRCGKDPGWTSMMGRALSQIETPIVLFMLADYWLAQPVSTGVITQFESYMLPHDISHIRLQRSDPITQKALSSFELDPRLFIFGADAPYRTSLQAALWRVKAFKSLLQHATSPWDFETNASVFASSRLRCLCIDAEKTPNQWNHHAYLCYHNIVSMGQWCGKPIDNSRESDVDRFIAENG